MKSLLNSMCILGYNNEVIVAGDFVWSRLNTDCGPWKILSIDYNFYEISHCFDWQTETVNRRSYKADGTSHLFKAKKLYESNPRGQPYSI